MQDNIDAQGHLIEFGDESLEEIQYNLDFDDYFENSQPDLTPSAMLATPSSAQDSNWYPDFGATHHITSTEENPVSRQEFTGSEKVILGNGMCLPISHIGQTKFRTPSHSSLILDKLIHICS